jgi:hypothetical protein
MLGLDRLDVREPKRRGLLWDETMSLMMDSAGRRCGGL